MLSWVSVDTGEEFRENSEALRMIRLDVSTTITLAVGATSGLAGQPERLPIAVERNWFLETELDRSGSRMMTLLAVIS